MAGSGREAPEQGVKAVTCHRGKAMWDAVDKYEWTKPLIEGALELATAHAAGDIRTVTAKTEDAAKSSRSSTATGSAPSS